MFGMEGNLDMIKKKVLKTKVKAKAKSKVKSKIKAKKVTKRVLNKIKNPVYLNFDWKLREAYDKYSNLYILSNNFVTIHSNTGIIYGMLDTKLSIGWSYFILKHGGENGLNHFLNTIYTLKTNFRQMPHRDDLSLIAETDDYLGNELFWDEHDEFRKDKFKKSTDFQFTLGNVDKVDVENNIIYVRRLKQIKDKND